MSDDDSPRPFRRERNLSNRNFKRRGSNRRYSTESHSSVDSVSLATESKDTSNTISTDDNLNVSKGSSSLQISYSVNSDTENAFNRRSLLKMKPPAEDGNEPQTPEPALLPVRQKVLHFEALQSEDRIIFKTGKYKSKSLQALAEATSHNTQHSGLHLGPLRVLPIFNRKLKQNGDTSSNSFHASIDEERSEDEVEDITDFAEDATTPTNEYIVPEIAKELTETSTLSSKPGEEFQTANTDINANVAEYGVDDFGKAESVRRTISADNTPIINIKIENHSSEQDAQNISNTAKKDFPRNFRSTPRPKTEIIGTINRNVKFNSVYAEKDDGEEDEEPQLREKCDKFVHPILEELIKTEETYVENLLMGIQNYGNIFQRADLPIGLRGKKYVLFGNIEQITEFHRDEFLPMLHRNRRDLKRLFLEFIRFIDENCFYSYVIFTMNKQRSLKLCDLYKNYFKMIQSDLDDKLGINSFLVQPIQRMARYPLLLKEFITALFKNREYVMKPLIESCCRLDKKVRTLLTTTNESEVINDIVDCNEFNVFYQGKFRKVSDFHVFDHTLKRSYKAKVFIFDKCIIYTEIKGKNLVFHGRYPCEHIGISAKTKSFTLYYERRKQQECEFSGDAALVETWLELIRDMINSYVSEERQKLQERYSRENDHLHPRPLSLSLFRDSNRFSSDSGIGNIWVMPKPESESETASNRTTWYAVS